MITYSEAIKNSFKFEEVMKLQDVPERYYKRNFTEHPATKDRWGDIQEYAKKPKNHLIMTGSFGNGKTSCAIAVLVEFTRLNGPQARYFNSETLYMNWRRKSFDGNLECFTRAITECQLLILDDFGQGEVTDRYLSWIYKVINDRYESAQPYVITTNLNSKEIAKIFGDRILSRLSGSIIWKFEGEDYRMKESMENF